MSPCRCERHFPAAWERLVTTLDTVKYLNLPDQYDPIWVMCPTVRLLTCSAKLSVHWTLPQSVLGINQHSCGVLSQSSCLTDSLNIGHFTIFQRKSNKPILADHRVSLRWGKLTPRLLGYFSKKSFFFWGSDVRNWNYLLPWGPGKNSQSTRVLTLQL